MTWKTKEENEKCLNLCLVKYENEIVCVVLVTKDKVWEWSHFVIVQLKVLKGVERFVLCITLWMRMFHTLHGLNATSIQLWTAIPIPFHLFISLFFSFFFTYAFAFDFVLFFLFLVDCDFPFFQLLTKSLQWLGCVFSSRRNIYMTIHKVSSKFLKKLETPTVEDWTGIQRFIEQNPELEQLDKKDRKLKLLIRNFGIPHELRRTVYTSQLFILSWIEVNFSMLIFVSTIQRFGLFLQQHVDDNVSIYWHTMTFYKRMQTKRMISWNKSRKISIVLCWFRKVIFPFYVECWLLFHGSIQMFV